MDYFPLFLDLRDQRVVIVGGGDIAARKIALLERAGACITVISPTLNDTLAELYKEQRISWLNEHFFATHVHGARLVVAATDDSRVNATVAYAAKRANIMVNVVDDLLHSNTIFPAIVDRSPVIVAVSSGGASPILTRLLREKLETLLPPSLGPLAALAGRYRDRIKAVLNNSADRRRFWDELLRGSVSHHLDANLPSEAAVELEKALYQIAQGQKVQKGKVILVGAGPGDPDLLTLKGLRAIQQADVILHDRLVSPGIMELVRRDAEKIVVGKEGGGHSVTQESINQLMIEKAQQGLVVVRLKGGDPFIFGRGGEELQALRALGIDYEVVPGITAALGCAAYAGIPLTHREHAQAFTLITAHCRAENDPIDWSLYADERHTLAVYMGVKQLSHITQSLIQAGRADDTPVAIIENGTLSKQRVIRGTLDTIGNIAQQQQVQSPALLIIGSVAALHDELKWFGETALETLQLELERAA